MSTLIVTTTEMWGLCPLPLHSVWTLTTVARQQETLYKRWWWWFIICIHHLRKCSMYEHKPHCIYLYFIVVLLQVGHYIFILWDAEELGPMPLCLKGWFHFIPIFTEWKNDLLLHKPMIPFQGYRLEGGRGHACLV